jgi:hypothetical protein
VAKKACGREKQLTSSPESKREEKEEAKLPQFLSIVHPQ